MLSIKKKNKNDVIHLDELGCKLHVLFAVELTKYIWMQLL